MIASKSTEPLLVKATGITALALLVASICAIIHSIEVGVWFSFSNASGHFQMKLLACDDCPVTKSTWTTDCFTANECDQDSESKACSQWRKSDTAGRTAYYMCYISIFCSIFLVERIFFGLLKKFTGKRVISYILATTSVSLQTIAIVQWFTISQIKLGNSCSDGEGEDMNFCAESGAISSICAVVSNALGCIVGSLYIRYSSEPHDVQFEVEGRRMFLLSKVLPVLLIVVFFEVFGLFWHWTYYDENGKQYNYATKAISYHGFDNYGHNCIAASACNAHFQVTSTKRECEAFERLYDAGILLHKMKLAEFVFTALWLESICYLSINKQYGFDFLSYVWPVAMILTQAVALISWAAISGASFTNNCQVLQLDKDINFCSDLSVIFAIIGIVVNLIAVGGFMIVHSARNDTKEKYPNHEEISPKQKLFEKNQLTQMADSRIEHSASLTMSALNESTSGPDSRAGSPMPKPRKHTPSILSCEIRPLSKRVHCENSCSLCFKR